MHLINLQYEQNFGIFVQYCHTLCTVYIYMQHNIFLFCNRIIAWLVQAIIAIRPSALITSDKCHNLVGWLFKCSQSMEIYIYIYIYSVSTYWYATGIVSNGYTSKMYLDWARYLFVHMTMNCHEMIFCFIYYCLWRGQYFLHNMLICWCDSHHSRVSRLLKSQLGHITV